MGIIGRFIGLNYKAFVILLTAKVTCVMTYMT